MVGMIFVFLTTEKLRVSQLEVAFEMSPEFKNVETSTLQDV